MSCVCFSKRLKEALKKQDMSQKELSDRTGISRAAISQYSNGIMMPRQDRLVLIAKILCVSEAWLLGYEEVDIGERELNMDIFAERYRELELDYERVVEENMQLREKLKAFEA